MSECKSHFFCFDCPPIPVDIKSEDRLSFFMERYGKSVGVETACLAFLLAEANQKDGYSPADIRVTVELVPE